jgi:hypothetical protein
MHLTKPDPFLWLDVCELADNPTHRILSRLASKA